MNNTPKPAGGSVLELKAPHANQRVSETSFFLLQIATLMASLSLLGSSRGITALAPLLGMAMRWVFSRFKHLPNNTIQELWTIAIALPFHLLFLLTATGGYARDPMGLLGLTEFALLAIFQLQLLRWSTTRLAMLVAMDLVVLLFHMSLSQDVVRSVWVIMTFLLLWIGLASRHPGHLIPRRRLSALRWGGRYAAWTLAIAAPLMLVFFILFPRLPLDALQGQTPERAGRGSTGLSNSMSIGSISELQKSNTPAFDAVFRRGNPGYDRLYWRGIVLDRFDGQTWTSATPANGSRATAALLKPMSEPIAYGLTWDLESQSSWVVTLDGSFGYADVAHDRYSSTVPMREDGTFSVSSVAGDEPTRRVHSTNARAALSWRLGDVKEQEDLADELNLPKGYNPRTLALGRSLRERLRDDDKIVEAALAKIRTEDYHYTLKPPRVGRDSIDDFLFETRAGFCEYYASSFVILMRAAGIPARVVTGYLSKPAKDGVAKVLQSDAHAWAEVWLGERGWVRQDPTAAIDPSRIDPDAAGLQMYINPNSWLAYLQVSSKRFVGAVDMVWREHMTRFDQGSQARLFEKLGVDTASKTIIIVCSLIAFMAAGILWQRALALRQVISSVIRRRPPMQELAWRLRFAGIELHHSQTWRQRLELAAERLDEKSMADLNEIISLHERLAYGPQTTHGLQQRALRSRIKAYRPTLRPGTPLAPKPGLLERVFG